MTLSNADISVDEVANADISVDEIAIYWWY